MRTSSTIRVITIEREYGCGGGAVAARLTERLGWQLWDRELTNAIARRARVPPEEVARREEKVDPLLHRLAKVFWRGSAEVSLPLEDGRVLDTDRLVTLVQQVIEEAAAQRRSVIVGRGASCFLRDRTDALHVFLYAPFADKLRWLVAAGTEETRARELLETVDHDRAEFARRYYGVEWPTRAMYHLMLNTALGCETVVNLILCALTPAKGSRGRKRSRGPIRMA